jgi:DNA repair exonuclease SbcCD ATPase subunit
MLKTLKLVNFRKHRDVVVDFTSGIQAVRAPNEGGKTTLIEGAAYCLFGSKALRTPIEQTVTMGEDVKTLYSELTILIDSAAYKFTRAKSGAEVILNGKVFCTGQNEVSAFAASLIGAELSIASKMMFAGQNGIRGALEEGPKALSTLIEDLAGFTVFDQILEAAQEKLALGSPALLEERLKGAEATLVAATESLPVKPDEEDYQAQLTALSNKMAQIESEIPGLKTAAEIAAEKFSEASQVFNANNALLADIERAAAQVNQCEGQVAGFKANAEKPLPDVEALKVQLTDAEDWDARSKAYQLFTSIPADHRYAGTVHDFNNSVDNNATLLRQAEELVNKADRLLMTASARRINHDKCDKCGQDVTHLEHVISTNAEVDQEVARLNAEREKHAATVTGLTEIRDSLKPYALLDRQVSPLLSKLADFVTIDESVFPPAATWIGEVPGDAGPDTRSYRDALEKAQAEVRVIEQAKAKLELVTGQLAEAKAKHAALVAKRDAYAGPSSDDILRLQEEKNSAALAVTAADGNIILAKREVATLTGEYTSALAIWKAVHARVSDAEKTIADTKADLESLSFNNTLIRKLRTIRPLVANQVWNSVLSSVSVMFSQMRGEESWVTKDKGGFCVNGQAVESLSGSTLDILGVALRVALMKTFLPQCGLLVLDEPCAAMDTSRTESLLGFIAGCGVPQVVLITHESVSESVADNLIEI